MQIKKIILLSVKYPIDGTKSINLNTGALKIITGGIQNQVSRLVGIMTTVRVKKLSY